MVLSPYQAAADTGPPPWVISQWSDPAEWAKINSLLQSGNYGGGDGASIENGFRAIYDNPVANANAVKIEKGVNAARLSWIRTAAPVALRLASVGGAVLVGLQVGSALNKHWLHMRERIGDTWEPTTITDVDIRHDQKQGLGPWSGSGNTDLVWHLRIYGGTPPTSWSDAFSSGSAADAYSHLDATHVGALLTLASGVELDLMPFKYSTYELVLPVVVDPDELKHDAEINTYPPDEVSVPLPWVWPDYDSDAGEEIRTAIEARPTLQDELNHQLNPNYVDDPVFGDSPTPDPLNPAGDPATGQPPYESPVEDPVVPPATGGGSSCPSPLATDLDFSPLLSSGLAGKFPFAVVAWMHTTLSGWAGDATAPDFTVSMAGHEVNVSLGLANSAMAIIRAALVIIGALGMVWWFSTALLGLRA